MAMEWTVKEVVNQLLLFLCVAGLSGSVTWDNFRSKFSKGRGLATGVLGQFFLLPFLGYLTVTMFDLSVVQGIPILVVTSSPGGVYSNWWCSLCNADLALSIAMTTVSTILAIFMLPLNMVIYTGLTFADDAESANFDMDVLIITAVITGLGVICGLLVQGRWPDTQGVMNFMGNATGTILLVWAAFDTLGGDFSPPLDFYFKIGFPLFAAFFIVVGVAISLDLPAPERSAVVVEVLFQNTTIPIAVAMNMYANDESKRAEALAVVLWYGFLEASVTGIWLLICWKIDWTFAPSDVPIYEFFINNFQPKDEDEATSSSSDLNFTQVQVKPGLPPLPPSPKEEVQCTP